MRICLDRVWNIFQDEDQVQKTTPEHRITKNPKENLGLEHKKGKKIVALATKQGKQLDWETRWCWTMSEKEARAGTVPHTPTRVALVNLA